MNDNCIILKKAQIVHTECDTVRMTADIIEPSKPVFHAFIEVEKEYEQYLSLGRADWLLYLVFPVAIREGYDVICEEPVTEMFLHNINEILIPHFLIGDSNAKKFKIHANTTSEIIGGNAIGTAVSCGVDSTYTIMEYTKDKYPGMKLTHLFIGSLNSELWDFDEKNDNLYTWEEKHKGAFERFREVSETTGLSLVKMFTNILFYPCDRGGRDFNKFRHVWIHHWISMSAVLSLRKLWKMYYFSSATDFITAFPKTGWLKEDPEYMAVISMHILALQDFHCYSGGASVNRIEKTRRLADYDLAKKILHPCNTLGKTNCSSPECSKCLRALLTLDYYEKLDEMKEVFDIQRYKDTKKTYFWWLACMRKGVFYTDLYKMMSEKYPEEMRRATKEYDDWAKPVPRATVNRINRAYEVSAKLFTLEDPRTTILDFFKEKNIHKLYCSGGSAFGNAVASIIKQDAEIELVTSQTGKCSECDAIYILSTLQAEIDNLSGILSKRLKSLNTDKPIYTFLDIDKYIKNIV